MNTIIIDDNTIINQTIDNIFNDMNTNYTLVYYYNKYITINYSDIRKQFIIDYPRMNFKYKKINIPLKIINLYLQNKKRSLKKKIMFFCTQILFAPILVNIHESLTKININYLVAELDNNDKYDKRVLTELDNNIISTTKIFRIVDIENNNKTIKKFILNFTMNYKTSNILLLTINFID